MGDRRSHGDLAQPEAPRAESAREHFPAVQALRGIAAAIVMLHHMFAGGHLDALAAMLPTAILVVIEYGWAGVPVFFALSGFVIAHSLRGQIVDPRYVGVFALRRSIRLDPPYWASLALLLGLGAVSSIVSGAPAEPASAWQVATHVTYTQLFAGVPQLGGVYWTLTYEVQFYLVLVIAVMMLQAIARRTSATTAGAIVYGGLLAVAVIWGIEGIGPAVHPALFTTYWASFFVGVLACHARSRGWAQIVLPVLVAVLLVGGSPHSRFGSIAAILLLAATTQSWGTVLQASWLQKLGTVSYSLYLTHNPFSGAAFFIARKALPGGAAVQGLHLAWAAAICLAGAWLFWRLFEVPAHHVSRALGRASARARSAAVRRHAETVTDQRD